MAVNTAQLDFNTSTRISSQGTSTDYANQSGKRTASALRAMRNSIFNLNQTDQKYEIYGDIIAGIGKVVTNPEVPDLPGGIVNIGGSGSILRGDVLAPALKVVPMTMPMRHYLKTLSSAPRNLILT